MSFKLMVAFFKLNCIHQTKPLIIQYNPKQTWGQINKKEETKEAKR
jgi:hypothetical protein